MNASNSESSYIYDEFFTFLSSKEKYTEFIENKMSEFEKNYAKMSKSEASKNFIDIAHDWMIFGSQYNLSSLHPLRFIQKYENLLNEENLIDVYFCLNDYESALAFIKLKKEELKRSFRKYYLAPYEHESTDDYPISDWMYKSVIESNFGKYAEKRKIFTIAGCYKENELNILLYRYFVDDVKFVFYNNEKNSIPLYGFCNKLNWKNLEEILIDLYKKGEYDKIKIIIEKVIYYKSYFVSHIEDKYPFNDFHFYGLIFSSLIPRFGYISSIDDYNPEITKQEKFILSNIEPSSVPCTKALSNEFIANLKFLQEIPKKDLMHHPLYNSTLEVYLSFCQSYYLFYKDEYRHIFKRIFNRLIAGASFLELMQINSVEALYHFYKTNEIINFSESSNITIDKIDSYITKQYFELVSILKNPKNESFYVNLLNYRIEDTYATQAINLLSFYGFSNAKKLLQMGINTSYLIHISKLKYEDEEERKLFLSIILKDIPTLKENDKNIDSIFKIFKTLKLEQYPQITLKKIIKRIKSFESVLLPNVTCIKENLLLLDLVSKGEPIDNKIEGIKLYNEYRLRNISSIPDVNDKYKSLEYATVDMHSPEIISNGIGNYLYPNGIKGSSCLTPAGKASSCLFHGAINPHGRFFKVMLNGKIVAYSWMWRAGDVLCFDNIEITDKATQIPDYEKVIMEVYLKATNDFIKISQKEEENPLKLVICGRNKIDMLNEPFEDFTKVQDYQLPSFKPNNSKNLYLDDSKETQYILYGNITEELNTSDTLHFYPYKRQSVTRFSDWSESYLHELINSIYFDYCLFTNQKYTYLTTNYTDGFIGEDWFIGYKPDGSYDLYYRTINDEITKEISKYLSISVSSLIRKPLIITHNYEDLYYLLNEENYEINSHELKEYLKSLREKMTTITLEDYYHTPRNMVNLGKIIYDKAITSAHYGKHDGGKGSNGSHFICIASLNSDLYDGLSREEGFILDKNLCVFRTGVDTNIPNVSFKNFLNSRYPIRTDGWEGELQVLDYIELTNAKGILINPEKEYNIAKVLYILENQENNLPLLTNNKNFYIADKKELKRLIKLK